MARRPKPRTISSLVVAYIRVSTNDQALGHAAQRSAMEAWSRSNGATIVAWHADHGVSGGAELADRPALMDAIGALEHHGAGTLLVAKRDRLARDVVLAAATERLAQSKGARVVAADGTSSADGPEGMLMRGLVDLFAQYERALIRSRTVSALAVKRARGERIGGVPIGFTCATGEKSLVEDAGEQASLARMRELRGAGFSLRAIARILNEEGAQRRGLRWHSTTVARVVNRAL